MSIFDKDVDHITPQDLAELLAESAVENVRLEFKREVPKRKEETLKKLSSFANTYGGFMIVGAEADKDGKLVGLPGVHVETGYKQRLVQWCFEAIWPPLEPLVSPPIASPSDPAKVCYVISIPESLETPHFLNGRKGAWIRTNEFSQGFEPQLAKYDELEHLRERRILVVQMREKAIERARKRFLTYLGSSPQMSGAIKDWQRALMFFSVTPLLPSSKLANPRDLEDVVGSYKESWCGDAFPLMSKKITQQDAVLFLEPAGSFSLFEATVYGQLGYGSDVGEVKDDKAKEKIVHLPIFVGRLLVFLAHAGGLLERLKYRGKVLVRMRLVGIRDVKFVWPRDYGRNPSCSSPLDDDVEFELSMSIQELRANRDDILKDVMKILFFSINWSSVAHNDNDLDQLVLAAYKGNLWGTPKSS